MRKKKCKHKKGEYLGKLTDPGPYWVCTKCGVAFKEDKGLKQKKKVEEGKKNAD